ncbi:MAG: TlpA family protein disulfide reductase [Thermodesulfobacteria bacterium]|nr:TlpA family protein disulfide reductase [Thermodesulfobacteriota bacterium]
MRKITIGAVLIVVLWLSLGSLASANTIPWDLELNLFNPSGKKLTFKDFKGKILIVNFFATYCPPCQVELLEFSELYKEFKPKGVEIISFMVDEGGERLLPHLISSKGITYYVAIADEKVLSAFGWPDLLPTTFLVDREGRIVRKFVGYVGKKFLEEQISSLLKEETAKN